MSLINQMLKDLEQRRAGRAEDNGDRPTNTNSEHQHRKQPGSNRRIFLLLAVAVLLLVGAVFYLGKEKQGGRRSASIDPASIVIRQEANQAVPPLVEISKPQPPAAAQPITFEGLIVMPRPADTAIDFKLSGVTRYRVNRSKGTQKLLITFLGTKLFQDLSAVKQSPAIKSMFTHKLGDDLQVEINLVPGAIVQKLEWPSKTEPVLQLVLTNPQPQMSEKEAVAQTEKSVGRVALPLTPEQETQQKYEQVLQLLEQGGSGGEVVNQLNLLLKEQPEYRPARETLALLLFKGGDLIQANQVLTVGLQQYPDYMPFIQLQANILVKQDRVADALNLLQKTTPSIEDNPGYYAFMAALYQRQGQYMMAARLYDQLVKLHPEQSTWWMGLGIALEAADKRNAALEAYAQALAGEDLKPLVRAFVENKISQLR